MQANAISIPFRSHRRSLIADPGQHNLSGRLAASDIELEGTNAELEAVLWGDNLTGEERGNSGIDFGALGFGWGFYAMPRRAGVELKIIHQPRSG